MGVARILKKKCRAKFFFKKNSSAEQRTQNRFANWGMCAKAKVESDILKK